MPCSAAMGPPSVSFEHYARARNTSSGPRRERDGQAIDGCSERVFGGDARELRRIRRARGQIERDFGERDVGDREDDTTRRGEILPSGVEPALDRGRERPAREQRVERAVFRDELRGGLLSDPGDAG